MPPGKGHRHDLSGVPVLVTENVDDYRKAISAYVSAEDVVLELGCHQGVTTDLIGKKAKEVCVSSVCCVWNWVCMYTCATVPVLQVVGVDKSTFNSSQARTRYPHIAFHTLDAFDLSGVLQVMVGEGEGAAGGIEPGLIQVMVESLDSEG